MAMREPMTRVNRMTLASPGSERTATEPSMALLKPAKGIPAFQDGVPQPDPAGQGEVDLPGDDGEGDGQKRGEKGNPGGITHPVSVSSRFSSHLGPQRGRSNVPWPSEKPPGAPERRTAGANLTLG